MSNYFVRKLRGKASDQKCIDCGSNARDWSQIHGSDPLVVTNYEPRCRKCHTVYDGHYGSKPCEPNCLCSKHSRSGNPYGQTKKCEPGCTCLKHTNSGPKKSEVVL